MTQKAGKIYSWKISPHMWKWFVTLWNVPVKNVALKMLVADASVHPGAIYWLWCAITSSQISSQLSSGVFPSIGTAALTCGLASLPCAYGDAVWRRAQALRCCSLAKVTTVFSEMSRTLSSYMARLLVLSQWFSNLSMHLNHHLLEHTLLGPLPRASHLVSLG